MTVSTRGSQPADARRPTAARILPPMPFRRVVLETSRLCLRPFTAADTVVHRHLYRDPEVTRYLGGGPFIGGEVGRRSTRALAQFARHWRRHGFGVWAVVE